MFDTKIIEIENRRGAEKVQLSYVKYLYSIAKNVEVAPEWKKCFNISVQDMPNNIDLKVILNTAASNLVHSNLIALEIVKLFDNEWYTIFVRTENA